MPLAAPPHPTPIKSAWSLRAWIAEHVRCLDTEIEVEYAGRWPGETRVRYARVGRLIARATIVHPGLGSDRWTIEADFVDGRHESVELPDDLLIDY